jgi:hypothetical protein
MLSHRVQQRALQGPSAVFSVQGEVGAGHSEEGEEGDEGEDDGSSEDIAVLEALEGLRPTHKGPIGEEEGPREVEKEV